MSIFYNIKRNIEGKWEKKLQNLKIKEFMMLVMPFLSSKFSTFRPILLTRNWFLIKLTSKVSRFNTVVFIPLQKWEQNYGYKNVRFTNPKCWPSKRLEIHCYVFGSHDHVVNSSSGRISAASWLHYAWRKAQIVSWIGRPELQCHCPCIDTFGVCFAV